MKLFYIHQNANTGGAYIFSKAVVVAETEEEARKIHPNRISWKSWMDDIEERTTHGCSNVRGIWCFPQEVECECIGEANDTQAAGTVICASFHKC